MSHETVLDHCRLLPRLLHQSRDWGRKVITLEFIDAGLHFCWEMCYFMSVGIEVFDMKLNLVKEGFHAESKRAIVGWLRKVALPAVRVLHSTID